MAALANISKPSLTAARLPTLENESTIARDSCSEETQFVFIRRLEMFAREKGKRQGFTHEDTKRTFTWIQSILSEYDQSDEIVRLARQFSEDYTEEMRSSAEPTDARISLKGFHLACAFDDHTSLRIILAGTFSITYTAAC
jgi:undecaprenyl pyrophosphate synthase